MHLAFCYACTHHDPYEFDCQNAALNENLRFFFEYWVDPSEARIIVAVEGRVIRGYATVFDIDIVDADEKTQKRCLGISALAVDYRYRGYEALPGLLREVRRLMIRSAIRGAPYAGVLATNIYQTPNDLVLGRLGFTPVRTDPLLWFRAVNDENQTPQKRIDFMRREPRPIGEADGNVDFFISHASGDKEMAARPIANGLRSRGYSVWLDESVLRVGDSLSRSIDAGLRNCKYGVVILSHKFFGKNWTKYELDSLVNRAASSGKKVILPVWHGVTSAEVEEYSFALANVVATDTNKGINRVIDDIIKAF
jgi:hypothetical protein